MVVDVDITAEQIASGLGSIMAVLLFSAPAKDIFGKDGVVWNKNTNNLATGKCITLDISQIWII